MRFRFRAVGTEHRRYLLVAAVLIFFTLGIAGAFDTGVPSVIAADVPGNQNAILYSLEEAFSSIAQRAEPGIVSITAIQRATSSTTAGIVTEDRLHGEAVSPIGPLPPGHPDVPVKASGSGIIVRRISDVYYVMTNYHVVEGAYTVNVRLSNGTALRGTVIGLDPVTDLAVVQMSSPGLSDRNIVAMGDSDRVKVGSWALAVGSPYGFEHSITIGIVSGLHRELEDDSTTYPDLIQTDAAINKGNSGGPLLDIEGRVIGINTAIASPTGGSIGLGFAIPVNAAKRVLDDLIARGRVVRGWLGVCVQDLTPVFQSFYGIRQGVLVASVEGGSPAAKAGLASEDIIVALGDTVITDTKQLQKMISDSRPGTATSVTFIRDGRRRNVRATVGLSPSTPAGRPSPPTLRWNVGIEVRTLSERLAKEIGLQYTSGAIVVGVETGSPAEDAGLEEGDIVTRFNGRAVGSQAEFEQMVANLKPGQIVVLRIYQDGETRFVGFKAE